MTAPAAAARVAAAGAARDERRSEGEHAAARVALDGRRSATEHAAARVVLDGRRSEGEHAAAPTARDERRSDSGATVGDATVLDFAVRRSARSLHAACAELLPGYAGASREPWRQALLTAGCLDGAPVRPAPGRPAPPLIVEDVVQPSDVLCALWLARRSGLFAAGSACGDGVGRRSACEIVPRFAPGVSERTRDEVWAVLRGNTAWRAHRAARAAA